MLQCALCHINNFRIARTQIKLYIAKGEKGTVVVLDTGYSLYLYYGAVNCRSLLYGLIFYPL